MSVSEQETQPIVIPTEWDGWTEESVTILNPLVIPAPVEPETVPFPREEIQLPVISIVKLGLLADDWEGRKISMFWGDFAITDERVFSTSVGADRLVISNDQNPEVSLGGFAFRKLSRDGLMAFADGRLEKIGDTYTQVHRFGITKDNGYPEVLRPSLEAELVECWQEDGVTRPGIVISAGSIASKVTVKPAPNPLAYYE